MPRSLILEPTRELAAQVAENFEKYGKYHKLSMALLIGGVSMGDQIKALERGVDVLIATPGRLMDLFGRGNILLTGCGLLVIDEADRMLDMGFIPDIEQICTKLPSNRQTLLFSATMPAPIKKLSEKFLKNPKQVEASRPASSNLLIDQRLVRVDARKKKDTLVDLLRGDAVKTAIVFSNRKTTVKELATSLRRSGFAAGPIHGDMEQADRIKELDRFKAGEINILVASDVAARGLDIKGVSHVFNFDVPWQPDDYIHRIGRTGRAGATGVAITLATSPTPISSRRSRRCSAPRSSRWRAAPSRPKRRRRDPSGPEPSLAKHDRSGRVVRSRVASLNLRPVGSRSLPAAASRSTARKNRRSLTRAGTDPFRASSASASAVKPARDADHLPHRAPAQRRGPENAGGDSGPGRRDPGHYPHDTQAFTQGLFFADGQLYESTGQLGRSTIRRVRLSDGKVLQSATIPADQFGEGSTAWGKQIVSLTWQHGIGYRWIEPVSASSAASAIRRRLGADAGRPQPHPERRHRCPALPRSGHVQGTAAHYRHRCGPAGYLAQRA
jgi:superfamily II DNA/RNA helicase